MVITGEVTGVTELLAKLKKIRQDVFDEVVDSLEDIGNLGKTVMQSEAPEATGGLKQSVTIDIDKNNNGARLIIFPEAEYAVYVEKGRGEGGAPPIENLRVWANAKGFPEDKLFVLARAIAQGRTKANQPNPFVLRTFDEVRKASDKMVSEAVNKTIKRIFK